MWLLCQHCIIKERNEQPDGVRIVLHVCVRTWWKSSKPQHSKSWISCWAFANFGFFMLKHKINFLILLSFTGSSSTELGSNRFMLINLQFVVSYKTRKSDLIGLYAYTRSWHLELSSLLVRLLHTLSFSLLVTISFQYLWWFALIVNLAPGKHGNERLSTLSWFEEGTIFISLIDVGWSSSLKIIPLPRQGSWPV